METEEEQIHPARGSIRSSDGLDQESIGRLAYFYWEERGCPSNSADEDWFKAEAELRNRLTAPASK